MKESNHTESSQFDFGRSAKSNENRSHAERRSYAVDSYEETKQNPDTQDMSNILDQSKQKSPGAELKMTPSA